ncbi:hypothetical protein A3Q56_03419 [Intoshia linei]|uniref:glutamine synthetase n=1 Tax=Intoshia linei TaxID=1819745 RepID=A0A177B3J6_9BILA|nr:hypothetical protein A3Q56_03419 [Intoshia linei]
MSLLDMNTNIDFMKLNQGDNVILTYVWIDGSGQTLRGKSKTLITKKTEIKLEDVPDWNFDGSSTEQATGINSDVYLKPVAIYNDPFFGGKNKLVMCSTYDFNNKPTDTNYRVYCDEVMNKAKKYEPMFGIEQEYVLMDTDKDPFSWPKNGFLGPQGRYYCSAGKGNAYGRMISDSHYKCCLYAGLTISGTNAEVMPSQWEYQIGPVIGISMGDQLWIHILEAINKLSLTHERHIKVYDPNNGEDNARRLTGAYETAPITEFISGVANRGASIRIPRDCSRQKCGYLEDRRPASNCDPYKVIAAIVYTTCISNNSF